MEINRSSIPAKLAHVPSDVLGFDLEMANSFPKQPPVICMVGLEHYDAKAGQCMATIATIEKRDEEEALINWFLDELLAFRETNPTSKLMTFSGTDNDLPWIRDRIQRYGITGDRAKIIDQFESLDLRTEFHKRTQNNKISLKKLEELFGIERETTLSSKKVSYLLTDILSGRKPAPIPDKVHQYLGEDVHHLLLILDRWETHSLEAHLFTEYEYLNQLLSLHRLSRKLLNGGRRGVEPMDREGLQCFAESLFEGMDAAIAQESFKTFELPAMPQLATRHSDTERLAKKFQALAEIQITGKNFDYRLGRQLHKPKGTLALVRRNGKVLMIKRADHLERAPGYWGLPGGVLESGETPLGCAERELREELNLDGRALQLMGTSPSLTREYELFWVEVEVSNLDALKPHPDEVAEARWVTPQQFHELEPLIPGAVDGFRQFLGPDWGTPRSDRTRR